MGLYFVGFSVMTAILLLAVAAAAAAAAAGVSSPSETYSQTANCKTLHFLQLRVGSFPPSLVMNPPPSLFPISYPQRFYNGKTKLAKKESTRFFRILKHQERFAVRIQWYEQALRGKKYSPAGKTA